MITIAQIGVGPWGQNHIRAFAGLQGCRLKLCCDIYMDGLQKNEIVKSHNIRLTKNFEDILKDREIQAVVIATSAATHAELAIKALNSGKHVLVEKPLALNLKDAEEIIKTADKNKRIVMVGHLLLYHPAVLKLKDYIRNGELGEILYLYSTRVNLGRIREDENALWSLTAHDISVSLFLLEDMPMEVTAKGESYVRKGIEDVVFVTLRFKNNILSAIHASWLDPHKIRKFTVVGSKKMVVFDDMQSTEKIRIYDKGFDWQTTNSTYEAFLTLREGDICIPKINMVEPLKVECQHFLDCINNGQRPVTDGMNGLQVLNVLTVAQRSLEKEGQPIRINSF
jgi:predicted dehydrogenase